MKTIDITPRPRTMWSLGHSNYKVKDGICDIIDNSLDANARNVSVVIYDEDKNTNLLIIDDGDGMSGDILEEAICLGSEIEKDSSQMGKFGMGLVTASISIGEKLHVVSKTSEGELNEVVLDPKRIQTENKWIAEMVEASPELLDLLSDYKSGTVIKVCCIDGSSQNLRSVLPKHLGMVYRNFLSAGRNIFVGSQRGSSSVVCEVDPLEWNDPETIKLEDVQIEIDGRSLRFRIANLSDTRDRSSEKKYLDANLKHQGIYVVRNNRQIIGASALGDIWKRHNNLNYLRAELSFTGDSDDLLGVTFDKTSVKEIPQSIEDKVKEYLNPHIKTVTKKWRNRKASDDNRTRAIMDKASSVIDSKKSLLDIPLVDISLISDRVSTNKGSSSSSSKKRKQGLLKKGKPKFQFSVRDMGASGPLYDVSQQAGGVVEVTWNSLHPFSQKVLFGDSEPDVTLESLQYLIGSFAMAQLRYSDSDEENSLILSIVSAMSNNLRTLMS